MNDFSSQDYTRHIFSETQKDDSRGAGTTLRSSPRDAVLLGESAAARRLRSQVERISPYFRIALLRGDAGTGKQHVARAMHALSPGRSGPFVVMSAAALAESVNAEEALGRSPASLLDPAHGGTLYLDGVGDLPLILQAGLYRFLRACEEGRATVPQSARPDTRIPDTRTLDTRILAASRRDVRTLASIGQFRQDLCSILSSVEIFVPSVVRRAEDMPALCEGILNRLASETHSRPKALSATALLQMQSRAWPGNLRELDQVLTKAAALAEGFIIEPRHMLVVVAPAAPPRPFIQPGLKVDRLHDVIHRHVLDVLTQCGGNKLRTAELLGISRSTLYRMLEAGPAEHPSD